MDINLTYKNLTCCSLELEWSYNPKDKNEVESYELFQREDGNNILTNFFMFNSIYKGNKTNYEVINLKPNQNYTFKIVVNKKESKDDKIIEVKTKRAPHAMLSINSLEIENLEFKQNKFELNDFQKKIIANCSKLNYEENNENILDGTFGIFKIRIKITHDVENNIYYISFDLKSDKFNKFFRQYIEEYDSKRVIIPCHFIIQNLPTLLILNLLEKSSIILTGKRMGGVIASSLGFYILNIGKSMNMIYGNTFLKDEKNDKKNIGVVSFGAPSFLSDMTVAVKMKEFTSYFYHIKEEFDFIPGIIDFISSDNLLKNKKDERLNENIDKIIDTFNDEEISNDNIELLNYYLTSINFTENNIKFYIDKFIRIPFGYYFLMKESDCSLMTITEDNFVKFYYLKKFYSKCPTSHLKVYKKFESNFNYNKKSLEDLVRKDKEIEIIKIIRRKVESQSTSDNSKIKVIIKFKFNKTDNNIITPDTIKKITLFYPKEGQQKEIIIDEDNIYYDNETDITAYTNIADENINMNINSVVVSNHFSGEMKAKYILNIRGSGSTEEMLYNNIEKIFLIPFFKLIEIFYISQNEQEKYNNLKEENFGKNFEELKILKPFEKQINALDELLLFTRPDILAHNENEFIKKYIKNDFINKYKENQENKKNNFVSFSEKIKNNVINVVKDEIKKYYTKSKELQIQQKFNCLKSENKSIAEGLSFPQYYQEKEEKKLFMCKFEYEDIKNLISKKFDNSYIKEFFLEKYIIEILIAMENRIKKDNPNNIKDYLNSNIGKFYNFYLIPKIFFIRMLILISIESGDTIHFYHKLNWNKFFSYLNFKNVGVLLNLVPPLRYEFYEEDFEKKFTNKNIEEINMKNIFIKRKIKNIINSNIDDYKSSIEVNIYNYKNRIKNFSNFSENSNNYGDKYYKSFLQLLNNCSNDFSEDIEISIYDNLKEENNLSENNFLTILDMVNDYIKDEESKKGFLALLKQSFLLGKLRTNIVSILYYIFYIFN